MPLFPAKSVNQLQQEYFESLSAAGTGLRFDITQGSVINALARGSAAVAASQYRDIRRLANSITLANLQGDDLDAYASFGLTRAQPTQAAGTVLAISPETPITVPPRTVLIDAQTTLQFETLNTSAIKVNYLEVPIPVRSLIATPTANLTAGTRLYAGNLTSVSFVVGANRSPDGSYYSDLTGGSLLESDEQYRNRIASWLANHTTASQTSLLDRLSTFPGVNRVSTNTNSGGVIEIWVDTVDTVFNEAQKTEIARYVKDYVADGIIVTVSQIERVPIDMLLEVKPYPVAPNASLNILSNRIREVIQAQMRRLEVGQNFSRQSVLDVVKPLAASVRLQKPTFDTLIKNGQLAVLGNLHTTYPA